MGTDSGHRSKKPRFAQSSSKGDPLQRPPPNSQLAKRGFADVTSFRNATMVSRMRLELGNVTESKWLEILRETGRRANALLNGRSELPGTYDAVGVLEASRQVAESTFS